MKAPARGPQDFAATVAGGVGASPPRPDGALKVAGEFAYSSDLWHEDMLWGATLRSPYPRAVIRTVDIAGALRLPGVHAVLTHSDVPGEKFYGLDVIHQPVLAIDQVRYQGEAVAIVAADHPEIARRALHAIAVDYQVLEPVVDPRRAAFDPDCPKVHDGGNLVRHQPVRRGDPQASAVRERAHVAVAGEYQVGMQDQAFLGPESGLAIPDSDGGVELHVATQWLHVDQQQLAPCLGLPPTQVRLALAGVGGAFGAREDLSMQVHACLLALRTGRPVKMVYGREESFVGHVHRHPATLRYEHGATRDGELVYATAEIVLDGGAYASTTQAVVGVAASLGFGPYRIENLAMDAYGVYTNNPPCGAMRGFGAVQACFAYESQMDKLAAALDMDPVELRIRNAVSQGDVIATGQVIDAPMPMADMLRRVRAMPLPSARRTVTDTGSSGLDTPLAANGPGLAAPVATTRPGVAPGPASVDVRALPGGVGNTTHGEGVVRGVGYGVGIKNICYSEGLDDYSTARVRLQVVGGEPVAAVHTAAAEVGQGLITLKAQIARTELGIERVVIQPADTSVGSAGSSSASRQSYMTGGAVRTACEAVRDEVFARVARRLGASRDQSADDLSLVDGMVVSAQDGVLASLADVLGDDVIERIREFRHRATHRLDPTRGQGDLHVQFAMCAHRAVVDVDVELGLVKVIELAAVQDVGKIMNPQALEGQIHGGSAQGLGLAVMEEIQIAGGQIRNPSFTDYLVPTIEDMPPMRLEVLEHADPRAPYGLRGAGEPPTLSSTPAIVAAIRAAARVPLQRVPVRPEHITGELGEAQTRPAR